MYILDLLSLGITSASSYLYQRLFYLIITETLETYFQIKWIDFIHISSHNTYSPYVYVINTLLEYTMILLYASTRHPVKSLEGEMLRKKYGVAEKTLFVATQETKLWFPFLDRNVELLIKECQLFQYDVGLFIVTELSIED